jgi:four helix bundle protein
MAAIVSYKDLESWKVGMAVAIEAFAFASQLPSSERFELGSQIRRAAVSIPSNIAEGQASGPGRRYHHHVRISLGSLAELETLAEIVRRRELVSLDALRTIEELMQHAGRLIHGLERSIRWRKNIQMGCLIVAGWLAANAVLW